MMYVQYNQASHTLFLDQLRHSLDTKHKILYYRKTSSTSRTKSQSLNVSCILVQLFSLNPLKPGVKLRMKM